MYLVPCQRRSLISVLYKIPVSEDSPFVFDSKISKKANLKFDGFVDDFEERRVETTNDKIDEFTNYNRCQEQPQAIIVHDS